ncbi:MAG: hypothetical protein M9928_02045 [Anaerolineae bacterium]|nr:hypothetical protein [Anaerolineae bacterium]MCO5188241.1 hypothetical protein [Anaerolineae bacterium]MCO5192307.1 hypothetical protein [Anaerolineae bacterium]MCO5197593.1 hypothetical protein [Anaerolineae bacterium]MCO5203785.1 hypothetical protein [Anaerolineae bacterium]
MTNVLRFIHIFGAIYWVGTTLFMVMFLEPTVRALGPDGGKFMQRLTGNTRFSLSMTIAGLLTIIAGLGLFGPVTGWTMDIMLGARLPLTLGAIAGIASALVGFLVNGRASGKMQALGKEMAAQGVPPKPEQLAQMQQLQATLRNGSRITAVLMVLAVIGMTW